MSCDLFQNKKKVKQNLFDVFTFISLFVEKKKKRDEILSLMEI